MTYIRATAITLFCALIFVLGMATENTARISMPSPYYQLAVTNPDGRTYQVDVLIDLKALIKEHGDDSRLLRYVDKDARIIIYLTQNSTGDIFTSMQTVPSTKISIHSPLYKRLWR